MNNSKTYLLVRKSPLSLILQSRDNRHRRLLYNDAEKKKQRSLRYASNQESPFIDAQDDNFICDPIVFDDGRLLVSEDNYVLNRFLEIHPDNVANGGSLFELWDPKKVAEEKLIMEDLILDAKIAARSLTPDKMTAIIRVFKDMNPDKLSIDELKWEIRNIANKYPQDFLEAIEDPDLFVDDLGIRAIKDGYISVRNGGRDLHYNLKDNKKRMFSVPMGEDTSSALVAWFKTEDGHEFYQYLVKQYEQ
jgi:hypothetical protein